MIDKCMYTTASAVDIPGIIDGLTGAGKIIKQVVYCAGFKAFLILYQE